VNYTNQYPNPVTSKVPQVSIGLPVYNGAKFIQEALDSLLAQSFTNFELIISDNASTDESEAICQKYVARDLRIRYVRQTENLGAIANFKFVLDEAVGEYFMWAAADDVWDKQWIEELLSISVDRQCLAFGMLIAIDKNSKQIQHPANKRKFNFTGPKFFRRMYYFSEPSFLGKPNPIYGIYPKKYLTENCFNILTSENGADMLFLYRVLFDIEIKGGAEVFLYKRIHDDCAGIGMQLEKKSLTLKIINFPLLLIISQCHEIFKYSKISSITETIIHILLTPYLLMQNYYYMLVKNPRFNKL